MATNGGSNNNNAGDERIPIVSALLTFALAIYRNASYDRIIQLLMSQFSEEEIKCSKQILCDAIKVTFQKRNNSDMRSEKTAHTTDICDMIRKIDTEDAIICDG